MNVGWVYNSYSPEQLEERKFMENKMIELRKTASDEEYCLNQSLLALGKYTFPSNPGAIPAHSYSCLVGLSPSTFRLLLVLPNCFVACHHSFPVVSFPDVP